METAALPPNASGSSPRSVSDLISDRALAIDASGIRKVFDLAATMKDPINLSIGLPDFDVPDAGKQAAIDAISRGDNRYTPTQGIEPLRTKIRHVLGEELGREIGDVLITSGVSGGLLLAILATINPGDEVMFADPYFVMYKHLIRMAGGVPVAVDTYPDFRFHADRMEPHLSSRTKLLILNSPANPTGVTMSEADVRSAVEFARKHDLLLLSDEIYEPFLYDVDPNRSLTSPLAIYDKTLLLRGFSKTYGMTGWRLGYAAGPSEILQQMAKLQQYTFVCAPSPFQHGALAAMDVSTDEHVAAYRRKRDIILETLSPKFELTRPDGAFYAFPKVPAGMSGSAFCELAIKNNVLVIPGSVFSERDTHFRISYATDDQRLRKGCEILCSLA